MSTPTKKLAKGTIVKLCADGGTLATFGRIENFTPPGQSYEQIQAPELNPVDDSGNSLPDDPIELGDENPSEFSFTQYWDPRDTDAILLETWFNAKQLLNCAFVTPHTTSATLTFDAKIVELKPIDLTKKTYYKREVRLVRQSVITNAATP